MPRAQMKVDGSGVGFGDQGVAADPAYKVIEHPNLDAVVSALAMATLDEINAIRTLAPLAQAAFTVDQWDAKIRAKLT